MKTSPLLLLIGLINWGIGTFLETHAQLPLAVTLESANYDLDGDGLRDRRDPVINFVRLSPKYQGDYAVNVHSLPETTNQDGLCLDLECKIGSFPTHVTTYDGGAFVLFHVPADFNGELQPWAQDLLPAQ
jgi:hypothetical protein